MYDMPKYNGIFIVAFFVLISGWTSSFAGNNSGAAFSTWPDTGQTKCYNNTVETTCPAEGQPFYGQDAQYNGPISSYTLLDGGTMVQDNVTGLIWENKNNIDGIKNYSNPNDADNTYTWCDTNTATNGGSAGTCGTNDTEDFIAQLNSGSGFGGFTDWRMPTIKELWTLVDTGRTIPAINPIFTSTSSYYWSSTTLIGMADWAWYIQFQYGIDAFRGKSGDYYLHYARAVRGGQNPPEDRFIDIGDDTVTDTVTCLQWQKTTMDTNNDGTPDELTWQDALAASENLNLAGHADWRLPNNNELHSLIDNSRNGPATYPAFAAATLSDFYWSSTTRATTTTAKVVWFGNGDGHYSEDKLLKTNYVRAVRDGQCGSLGALGDINKDGFVDLSDAVLALQVVTGKRSN